MKISPLFFAIILINLSACNDKDLPPLENEEEIIDMVRLNFEPTTGNVLVYEAIDPDGEGPQSFNMPIIYLDRSSLYTLTIDLENTSSNIDISAEVEDEGIEHMLFFEWTEGIFTNPLGNGNVNNRSKEVNYLDLDNMGLPIGLTTSWETQAGDLVAPGSFRVILKHQPGLKSATSTVNDGETDVDLTWEIRLN